MVVRLGNIEEKLDILTESIIGMKEKARELVKLNESLSNQLRLLTSGNGNDLGIAENEPFIMVSIS